MSPEKSSHMVHVNGKKRARHGRLAIRRQIFFCPMRMDDFIRPNTFVVKARLWLASTAVDGAHSATQSFAPSGDQGRI